MPESDLFYEIASLTTEQKNPDTLNIDKASTEEVLRLISNEDKKVPLAVESVLPDIARAVDMIVSSFRKGGRLFYFGAGTSGRLGILDASECPPTFGAPFEMVNGIIAGGKEAVFRAQEGAEDSEEKGADEIVRNKINPTDVVCGIAASGRTPFVKGVLAAARNKGIPTILITTAGKEKISELGVEADIIIAPEVGPEVIAGSTRMKSGTAQKLILNMLTTASFIRMGKTYGNVMIDLQLTNAKLGERAKRILMEITGVDYDDAQKYLSLSKGNVKTAIVMIMAGVDYPKATEMLSKSGGFVRQALEII